MPETIPLQVLSDNSPWEIGQIGKQMKKQLKPNVKTTKTPVMGKAVLVFNMNLKLLKLHKQDI